MTLRNLLTFSLLLCLAACGQEESGGLRSEVDADASSSLHLMAGLNFGKSSPLLSEKVFYELDGTRLPGEQLAGKPVLVNFWATWCAPCIEELPALDRAAAALDGELLVVLASDESLEQIGEFIGERGFASEHFVKLEDSLAAHDILAVPSTLLYGPDGRQVNSWVGPFVWDSPEVLAELRGILAELGELEELEELEE